VPEENQSHPYAYPSSFAGEEEQKKAGKRQLKG